MDWVYGGILLGAAYTILVAIRRLVAHARGGVADGDRTEEPTPL
jgi:hypothetical protein